MIGGHGHTRSRASISISGLAPSSPFGPGASTDSPLPGLDGNGKGLVAPSTWTPHGTFPSSPPGSRGTSPSPAFGSPVNSSKRASFSLPSASLNPSSSAPLPPPGPPSIHVRKGSRHSHQLSVTNFRESLEIVSGQGIFLGGLQPTVGSFTSPNGDLSPSSPASTGAPSPTPLWSNDPARVLEALKERGRREMAEENDSTKTRMGALEALEGRLAAPSEMIDLGNAQGGQLLFAPPSPGYTGGVAPASPLPGFSPVIGLGLASGKRNSWSGPSAVLAAGAKGAMELGMLAEEEEEDEDDLAAPLRRISSRKSSSPPRKRPTSLFLAPAPSPFAIPFDSPTSQTPAISAFSARPMRLSLSLSATPTSAGGTPSTSSSERPPVLRSLTLGATPSPTSVAVSSPAAAIDASAERRRHSLFHGAAVATANATASGLTSPTLASAPSTSTPPAPRGLRSLSIATGLSATPSPTADSVIRKRSPVLNRRSSITSSGGPSQKRSSISYNTSPMSSLASPEGPLSATSQAARRPWRTSISNTSIHSVTSDASPPTNGLAFAFAPSNGSFGGFGDLEVDEDDSISSPSRVAYAPSTPPTVDTQSYNLQINALRATIEQLQAQNLQAESMRGLEMADFEKKVGEEARSMRMRISELERAVEEGKVARRFEVEGLSREVEQAREAIVDLSEERDSLREDVDGWRTRCAALESSAKKDREEESMVGAQAKLIGEMRDQIYNLVAALEVERSDHGRTKQEVERMIVERASSPPPSDDEEEGRVDDVVGNRRRSHADSDASALSLSSMGRSYSGNTTEGTSVCDDSSKINSPTAGDTSFASNTPPTGSRDFVLPAASGLHTLAEVEEEEEDTTVIKKREEETRVRVASASTGSTSSDAMPGTPTKDSPVHDRSDSFVRHWSVSLDSCLILAEEVLTTTTFSSPRAASRPCALLRTTTTSSSTSAATRRSPPSPSPSQSSLPSSVPTSPSTRTTSLPPTSPSTLVALRHLALSVTSRRSRLARRGSTRHLEHLPSLPLPSPTSPCSRSRAIVPPGRQRRPSGRTLARRVPRPSLAGASEDLWAASQAGHPRLPPLLPACPSRWEVPPSNEKMRRSRCS
jgi:hypothetical protein